MPQMAPMNWLSLFIMFTMIFMLFNSFNYFNYQYKPNNFLLIKKSLKNSWKW